MIRLAGFGAALLVVLLAGFTPLWLQVGGAAWVAIVAGFAHGLAMLGLAQWALGDVHRTATGELPPLPTTGPADYVTMARSILGSVCLAIIVLALGGHLALPTWWLIAPAIPALVLDAVDGPLARRTGTARPAGARYDMECDAMALMVLSLAGWQLFGWWVLLIGAMRYLFVLVGVFVPRLHGSLAYSRFRRVVAGFQGAALVIALGPVVPHLVGMIILVVALVALAVSFGRDAVTLLRPSERTAS